MIPRTCRTAASVVRDDAGRIGLHHNPVGVREDVGIDGQLKRFPTS